MYYSLIAGFEDEFREIVVGIRVIGKQWSYLPLFIIRGKEQCMHFLTTTPTIDGLLHAHIFQIPWRNFYEVLFSLNT